MAVFLALCSAAVVGSGDFFGGFASRHTTAVTAAMYSNGVGALFFIIAAPIAGGSVIDNDIWWSTAAGVAGAAVGAAPPSSTPDGPKTQQNRGLQKNLCATQDLLIEQEVPVARQDDRRSTCGSRGGTESKESMQQRDQERSERHVKCLHRSGARGEAEEKH